MCSEGAFSGSISAILVISISRVPMGLTRVTYLPPTTFMLKRARELAMLELVNERRGLSRMKSCMSDQAF
ncbi:hypothetical protein D3C81_2133280 [compost metagenome]